MDESTCDCDDGIGFGLFGMDMLVFWIAVYVFLLCFPDRTGPSEKR